MDDARATVRCPDRDPQRQFVHRITEAECARRQVRGYHKCHGCARSVAFQRRPGTFKGTWAGRRRSA